MMDPFIATLDPYDAAAPAARRIVNDQLQAMPVTVEGRLIGVMTIDAAIRQLVPASSSLQTYRVFS